MARQQVVHAELEFFGGGGEQGSMPQLPFGTLRYVPSASVTAQYGYQSLYVGMPVALPLSDNPALLLYMPQSRERRPMPQKKFIDYVCEVRLAWLGQGDPQTASVSSDARWTFYGWVDAIAQMIRGGPAPASPAAKELITPSYPTGGDVIVWGETFSIEVSESVMETGVLLMARFLIDCTEQVNA